MQGKSNYLQNKLDDFLYRAQTFAPASPLYVGLLVAGGGIRAASTAYTLNQLVVVQNSTANGGDGLYHLYLVTTAGTTAATQPTTYTGAVGEAITDGTAVLTEQTTNLKAVGSSFVEASGGAYARVSVASSLANWSGTQGAGTTAVSSGTTGQISNNNAITFPTSSAAWAASPAVVWATFTADALTAGNVYHIGSLTSPVSVGSGVTPSLAAGSLSVTEL